MQLSRIFSWILFGIVLPCAFALPVPSNDVINSIKDANKKNVDENVKSGSDDVESDEINNNNFQPQFPPQGRPYFMPEMTMRQNKMFGFFGYIPTFAPIPAPAFYPTLPTPDYFSDYSYYGYNDDDDDMMSRANTKKRPNQFKNSPIYYIRLPPTPYMFVPGLGYISQPPTYQPMAPVAPVAPIIPPVVPGIPGQTSPFYNLPLNFMANGKPTNIYQWQGGPTQQQSPMMPSNQFGMQGQNQYGMQSPTQNQFGMQGQNQFGMQGQGQNQFGMQSQPSYNPQAPPSPMPTQPAPQRPHKPYRPYPRPQNTYVQDSKVTHLKGPFLFNGRPEDIYLLSNMQNFQNPYNAGYYPDPYSYNNYNPYNNPYY
uniref:CSON006179 protein n=1 Tax=Culicoides sonorensis TaxID=179676 RepID=A0A336M127_CULSO